MTQGVQHRDSLSSRYESSVPLVFGVLGRGITAGSVGVVCAIAALPPMPS